MQNIHNQLWDGLQDGRTEFLLKSMFQVVRFQESLKKLVTGCRWIHSQMNSHLVSHGDVGAKKKKKKSHGGVKNNNL